jgi:hypothetical protein
MKIGFGKILTKFGVSTMRSTYEVNNNLDSVKIFLWEVRLFGSTCY